MMASFIGQPLSLFWLSFQQPLIQVHRSSSELIHVQQNSQILDKLASAPASKKAGYSAMDRNTASGRCPVRLGLAALASSLRGWETPQGRKRSCIPTQAPRRGAAAHSRPNIRHTKPSTGGEQ